MDDNHQDSNYLTIYKAFNCYEVQRSITQYLSVLDLKSLRLVNKHWMECASISLKEKSHVVLNSRTSLQNYITFLQNSSLCFANYQITIKPDQFEDLSQAKDYFRELWDFCHDSVVELSVSIPWTCAFPILHCIFYQKRADRVERLSLNLEDVENGNDKWKEFSEKDAENTVAADGNSAALQLEQACCKPVLLSSLIAFTLNVSGFTLNSEKKVFPFTWPQFFQMCRNVCHLSIQSDYASGHFCRIITTLVERRMGLRTLRIGTRDQRLFSSEFLKQLCRLTSNETTAVSLGFLPSVNHDSPLDSILSQSSFSIRHLTFLQIRTSNQATLICFTASDATPFPNLTSLRITKELVPNLNFLVRMPKLKRLEILRDSTIGQHDALSNPIIRTRSLPVMNTLQSLLLEPFIPAEYVWKLVRWFPNLQRLQLKANDVIARIIFMSWSELKELYLIAEISRDNNDIVRSSLTDEGITGFSKEFLQQQDFSSYASPEWSEIYRNSINRERTVAHIGNLEKLETCKLQTVPDYQTGLTDFSIYFGLMQMPSLRSLNLVKTLVSPVAADHLRRHGRVTVAVSKY